jgi:hypothetical protein
MSQSGQKIAKAKVEKGTERVCCSAPFASGNISLNFLTIKMKICDKNSARQHVQIGMFCYNICIIRKGRSLIMEENEQWVHQKNLAYNIKVIELAWKVIKHKLGKNIVSGNELNFNNFYGTLERSRETIRNIKHMELNGFNEKHINVWASRIQTKTGISDKYLNGEKRIILSEKFDSKYYKQFDDYMEWWEKIDEHLQIAKDKPLYHHSYEELQKMIEEEDKKEDKKVDKKEVNGPVSRFSTS